MSKFDEFVNAVLNGARDLAVVVFNGLEDSAKDDAKAFLEKFEADLKRWTKLLAVEEITDVTSQTLFMPRKPWLSFMY
ncbi:MAG: hypothetical protein IPP21_12420 [Betaproteobacteria bacterium]|nr:hypothetical protein [Betaproteobacteria bacterium]